jgi:hypothetical protein
MDEIREKIAQYLYEETAKELANFIEEYSVDVRKPRPWDKLPAESKLYWLEKADQILTLLKEAGYISPEECKQCQQRQADSEKIFSREAAFDERELRDEVKYWKDKAYDLEH